MAHCSEARRVRRELDKELAAVSAQSGRNLVWSAADRAVLALIADAIDRKNDLLRDYAQAVEAKTRVKLSAEIRLLESHVGRLLKQVKTDVPAPESLTTIKARRAAHARWDRAN